jgi:hypothetical protein
MKETNMLRGDYFTIIICLITAGASPAGFQVNTYTNDEQANLPVAMKSSSEFVTVRQNNRQDRDNYGIFGEFGPKVCCADFSNNLLVNFEDFAFLAEEWFQEGDSLQTDLIDDNKINELDLGASAEQWLKPCYKCDKADIHSDGKIDFTDYALLANDWLKQGSRTGDITGNGTVDMVDLKVLAFHWPENCDEFSRKTQVYFFSPEQSELITRNFSWGHQEHCYTIEGYFQLTYGFNDCTATFDLVDANLSEIAFYCDGGLKETTSLDTFFHISELVVISCGNNRFDFIFEKNNPPEIRFI